MRKKEDKSNAVAVYGHSVNLLSMWLFISFDFCTIIWNTM